MLYAQIKFIIPALAIMAGVSLASCGNSDKENAEGMFEMASIMAEQGDYDRAVLILDSIDSIYPEQVDTRRKSLHLRPVVLEKQTLRQIEHCDSVIAALELKGTELQSTIVKVDNPVEPYFVASGMKGKSVVGGSGLEARMMPDGTIYMISSLAGHKVNHTSVTVSVGSEKASTSVIAHDGERNDRSLGYEVIHYMPGECSQVCELVAKSDGQPVTVTFNGEKGASWSTTLAPAQVESIAVLHKAAGNVSERHRATIEKARLEKLLERSREHQARTLPDE